MEIASGQRRGDYVIRGSARLIFATCISSTAVHSANRIIGRVRIKVRMVKQVERVQRELQIYLLGDLPRFLQREIIVDEIRPMAEALRLVADVADVVSDHAEGFRV